jgi:hypothetical protein
MIGVGVVIASFMGLFSQDPAQAGYEAGEKFGALGFIPVLCCLAGFFMAVKSLFAIIIVSMRKN